MVSLKLANQYFAFNGKIETTYILFVPYLMYNRLPVFNLP